MSIDNITALAIAELVIYIFLLPLIFYILIRHGKNGLLAYVYLVIFDILRVVPAAMRINSYVQSEPESSVTEIINSIGLSPLLLCAAGVLHEIQHYIGSTTKADKMMQTLIHTTTIIGVVLSAIGAADLLSSSVAADDVSNDEHLIEAGTMLLLLAWILLALSAGKLFGRVRAAKCVFVEYICLCVALVPLAVRVVYGVVYGFDHSPSVSPLTGTFAIQFVFVFLMLLLPAISIIVGGVLSRNVVHDYAEGQYHPSVTHIRQKSEDGRTAKPDMQSNQRC